MENEPLLTLHGVAKSFDGTEVLHPLDLTVDAGEFLTLLGPSGCGKTTILRVIAGLEAPESGTVMLEGRDVTALPPEKRPVNTVFQSYALFPHMNVSQNIAYGLKMRGVRGAEAQSRVDEMLSLVQLEGYGKRMPTQLSGGQRQRVAIARALVLRPRLLLLDEPLGALDLQLRRQMQTELKNLQRKSGIAFIYVTHDQEEALNMSDRIVVMNAGHFCQQGAPEEIYEHPNSMFTAKFIGQTNLVRATVTARHPQEKCALDIGGLSMPGIAHGEVPPLDAKVCICLRMERVHFSPAPHSGPHLPATVTEKRYTGGTQRTVLKLHDGQEIIAIGVSHDGSDVVLGQSVAVWWDPAGAALVPEEEEA